MSTKRAIGKCFILLIIVMRFAIGLDNVYASEPIVFRFAYEDNEVFPYWIGETNEVLKVNPGLLVDSMIKVDELIPEISIHFIRLPWKRCQSNLQDGLVDGIIGSYKKDRMELGDFPMKGGAVDESRYLHTQSYCMYVSKDSRFSWNGKEFVNSEKMKVAVPRGYSIIEFIKRNGIVVHETSTTDQCLQMLILNRVNGVITLSLPAKNALKKLGNENKKIVQVKHLLENKKYYIIISKQFHAKYPAITEKIWSTGRKVGNKYFPALSNKYLNQ